jgi:hypothetical protein
MQRGGYPTQQQQQAVPAAEPAVDDDWGTVEQLLKRESEEDASLQVGDTHNVFTCASARCCTVYGMAMLLFLF